MAPFTSATSLPHNMIAHCMCVSLVVFFRQCMSTHCIQNSYVLLSLDTLRLYGLLQIQKVTVISRYKKMWKLLNTIASRRNLLFTHVNFTDFRCFEWDQWHCSVELQKKKTITVAILYQSLHTVQIEHRLRMTALLFTGLLAVISSWSRTHDKSTQSPEIL